MHTWALIVLVLSSGGEWRESRIPTEGRADCIILRQQMDGVLSTQGREHRLECKRVRVWIR